MNPDPEVEQFPSSIKVKPSLKLIQVCIQTNSEVALPFSLPAFTFQKVVAEVSLTVPRTFGSSDF